MNLSYWRHQTEVDSSISRKCSTKTAGPALFLCCVAWTWAQSCDSVTVAQTFLLNQSLYQRSVMTGLRRPRRRNRARVYTVHSFCAGSGRLFPSLNGSSPPLLNLCWGIIGIRGSPQGQTSCVQG